jgi:T5orf172 domain
MPQGFVYILISPNSDYIKIGGTERPIEERLRGINGGEAYASHGPWDISDFVHVTDWRLVEGEMHRQFSDRHIATVEGTRELFGVPPHEARQKLRSVAPTLRVDRERTDQLFGDQDVRMFLLKLFHLSGLYGSLDIQGAWTLSVLPRTAGGRWYTINIGPHEVAFSGRTPIGEKFSHFFVLDRLILEYPESIIWIGRHDGEVGVAGYSSAERAVLVRFNEDFARAEKFFALPGVRRALVAYWGDSLADLRQRNAKSVYARYHSYDAVSQLLEHRRATQNIFRTLIAPA